MPRPEALSGRVRQRRTADASQVKIVWRSEASQAVTAVPSVSEVATYGVPGSPPSALVRGDAVAALRCLPDIAHSASLCYIDPPFNTGQGFDHYDDALTVEDWLALMRESLLAIRSVLATDGSVWVHLDDSRQHHARCLLDEVFGSAAFVSTVIWQKRTSRDNRTAFSSMHDYIHVYAPSGAIEWKKRRNPLSDDGAFSNPDDDPRGPWRSVPLSAQAGHGTSAQFYRIQSPAGVVHDPPPGRCWTYSQARFEQLVTERRVYWPRGGRGKPRLKRFQDEVRGLTPGSIWLASEVGENADAKKQLLSLCAARPTFDTPKPEPLIERVIQIATKPGELVVDAFLGSGTTAVVAHRLGRRWIGVERNADTLSTFALPRLHSVLESHGGGFVMLDVDDGAGTREAAS